MRADRAEVTWDDDKSKWLVRISSGDEVLRRYCALPKNAADQDLRTAAEKQIRDDGYELDASQIVLKH